MKERQFMVIGAGRFGSALATTLYQKHRGLPRTPDRAIKTARMPIKALDSNEYKPHKLNSYCSQQKQPPSPTDDLITRMNLGTT